MNQMGIEEILIDEKKCRGCELCCQEEICKPGALTFDKEKALLFSEEKGKAIKIDVAKCIGCLECIYICPANIIVIKGPHLVGNYYRDIGFSRKLEKFI